MVEDVVLYLSDRMLRVSISFLFLVLIWKKNLYAYEAATDLIRFQLHGWVQSSAATDASHFLSQIRKTSCIHDYGEYADKCFTMIRTPYIYVMHISFFSKHFYQLSIGKKVELLLFHNRYRITKQVFTNANYFFDI